MNVDSPFVIDRRFALEQLEEHGPAPRRARDLYTGQQVALALVRVDRGQFAVENFMREAQQLVELRHPNIAAYVAYGTQPDGAPYLVTEWLAGEDLGERLRRPLSVAESLVIVRQIAG